MSGNRLKSHLTKYLRTSEIISVYTDRSDWDRFGLGILWFLSDYWFVLSAYSKLGEWEGYGIRPTPEINKFHLGGKYEKFVASLVSMERSRDEKFVLDFPARTSPVQFALSLSKEQRIPIQIWGADSSISEIGIVDELTDGILFFRLIDRFGKFDAKMILDVDEISAIDIWSRELRALEAAMTKSAEIVAI
jgi:hypothetical protein